MATPRAYDLLPNSNVVPGIKNAYMISFYHQLHCLRDLQMQYMDLAHNRSATALADLHHAGHCFSYIRQGIMCAGDSTLELPDKHPEPGMSPLRGWDIKHSCRNWGDLIDWMNENAAAAKIHDTQIT